MESEEIIKSFEKRFNSKMIQFTNSISDVLEFTHTEYNAYQYNRTAEVLFIKRSSVDLRLRKNDFIIDTPYKDFITIPKKNLEMLLQLPKTVQESIGICHEEIIFTASRFDFIVDLLNCIGSKFYSFEDPTSLRIFTGKDYIPVKENDVIIYKNKKFYINNI